ncbi:hypothetical protein TanjilG_00916 [Lupinus angustifolius]|uniref:Ribosomal protein L15 n=1 Tax=Lupinus angustifolius TaxID=3871 RepID=A0A4P1QQW4_LUPAN|nr:hypothetical protein TanjilG_00916 [Lupinus angustifolius]
MLLLFTGMYHAILTQLGEPTSILLDFRIWSAYKYVSELWRKKQSDVMRFLQRVRCWEYRQQPSIVRLTRPTRPDKARRLGYKAKQGYVVYRVRVRRGGRKRPVPKGIVYGKPTNQGVTQLKFQRSKRSVAEERAGRKLGGLRVLNSYWVNELGEPTSILLDFRIWSAYKYVSELWRKKQSDVMRFLQRVRCWEYRQQPSIVRLTRPTRPDKARRLGYKAKQGYVVYRVRVRRGGRKRPVPKGIVYGKPTNQGVTQLKFQRSKRSVAEERAGRKLGGLRVLNSYWVNEDSTYKYFEIILVDVAHAAIRNDPRINWLVNPVHKHRELRGLTSAGKSNRGLRGKGHRYHKNRPSRRATWKRNNTLSLRRYR